MKENRFGEGRIAKFIAGKGFYAALAVCLAGAAVADRAGGGFGAAVIRGAGPVPPGTGEQRAAAETEGETVSGVFWPFTQETVYAMPAESEIIQDYSGGELVKNETLGEWRTHGGIDIKCESGADICAPADGKITRVWSALLWGECAEM